MPVDITVVRLLGRDEGEKPLSFKVHYKMMFCHVIVCGSGLTDRGGLPMYVGCVRVAAVKMCQCWCSETKVEAKAESRGSEHVSVLL